MERRAAGGSVCGEGGGEVASEPQGNVYLLCSCLCPFIDSPPSRAAVGRLQFHFPALLSSLFLFLSLSLSPNNTASLSLSLTETTLFPSPLFTLS